MSITCYSSIRRVLASFPVMSHNSFRFLLLGRPVSPQSLSCHVLHFFLPPCWLLRIGSLLLSWLLLLCCCVLLFFSASSLLLFPRFRLQSSLCADLSSYQASCHMFLPVLICFVATLVPCCIIFNDAYHELVSVCWFRMEAVRGCYVSQQFSIVSESWFCSRCVISRELELDFSSDQVVVCMFLHQLPSWSGRFAGIF